MTVRTATVRTLDVPLGSGRQTLRLILHLDGDGEPEALSLALGFGGGDTGDSFSRAAWGEPLLQLPPDAIEPLRDALERLMEGAAE